MSVLNINRRSLLASIVPFTVMGPQPARAWWSLLFTAIRIALGGLARGSITKNIVRQSLSAAGTAGLATVAPRVAAAAPLVNLAVKIPRAISASRAERAAHALVKRPPYAARNPEAARRAAELMDLSWDTYDAIEYLDKIASKDVQETVTNSGDGSVEQAVLAYYSLLDRDDCGAAMSLWIAPKSYNRTWKGICTRWNSDYYVTTIETLENDGYFATTRVFVAGRSNAELFRSYEVDITWVLTAFGWLITSFKRASIKV